MSCGNHNRVAGCTLRNIGTVGVAIGMVAADLERRVYTDTTYKGNAGTDNGVVSCEIYDASVETEDTGWVATRVRGPQTDTEQERN